MSKTRKLPNYNEMVSGTMESDKQLGAKFGNITIPRGFEFIKPKIGKHLQMDFMMYEVTNPKHLDRKDETGVAVPGTYHYRMPYLCHKGIGVNNETVTCPTMYGKPCPICEHHAQLKKQDASQEELSQFGIKRWVLYVVIPIDSDEYEEEMYLFNISQANFQKQLIEELEEKPQFRNFPDLENGYAIDARFGKGSFKGFTFPVATRIDFKDRNYAYPEEILDDVPKLDELIVLKSYEELETILHGSGLEMGDDEQESQETETKEKPKKAYRKPKQNKEEQSEEDDTPFKEDERIEEEEGETEKPIKKQPKQTKEKPVKNVGRPKGSGKKEKTAPSKATKKQPEQKQEKSEPEEEGGQEYECPVEEGEFGRDWRKFDYCKECDIFDPCMDEHMEKYK